MIFFNGKKLSEIEVITDGKPSSEKAKRIFEEYAEKTCGKADKRSGKTEIAVTEFFDDDFFDISQSGEGIRIEGGKRGVIYGVYEIFERAGWRFLAKGIEYFPEKDVYLTSEDITTTQTTPVKYREVLGNSSGNSANSFLKFRHNTNFWAERLKEEEKRLHAVIIQLEEMIDTYEDTLMKREMDSRSRDPEYGRKKR